MSDTLTILGSAAEAAREALGASADGPEVGELLRAVRSTVDALEGVEAEALDRFAEVEGFREEGASSIAGWVRRELRMTAGEARARVRVGRTLEQLPDVADASAAGEVRLDHVKEFTLGVTKIGREAMAEAQDYLVPVAKTCDPAELRATINQLREVVDPDRLDRAYAAGMDKTDIKLARCGDGYHVTGFLDIATGTAFQTMLQAGAAPRDAEDERTPSQRRMDAIREMVSSILDHGMPCDRGVRPQLHVIVDAETLAAQTAAEEAAHQGGESAQESVGEPATLSGFGPIGADLLDYLRCNADVTPFLVNGTTDGPTPQADVLNVGRSFRLATVRQRSAVRLRQGGECANPGCGNTHLEVHHVRWWERDKGTTDLDNLVGLCPRCHHLIHTHKLVVEADGARGFVFTRTNGRRIDDDRRTQRARVRRHMLRLRRLTRDDQKPVRERRGGSGATTERPAGDGPDGNAAAAEPPEPTEPSQSPDPTESLEPVGSSAFLREAERRAHRHHRRPPPCPDQRLDRQWPNASHAEIRFAQTVHDRPTPYPRM